MTTAPGDSFTQLLATFQQNYLEYKVTGNAVFKTAYEAAQGAIEQHLAALRQKSESDGRFIETTVANYQQTNPELTRLSNEMKKIQDQGPKLQDQYETQQKRTELEAPDTTTIYIKVGLIAGLGLITLLVSIF